MTTFTQDQIKWAQSHDWCISANSSRIIVRGDIGEHTMTFTSISALRMWAGY